MPVWRMFSSLFGNDGFEQLFKIEMSPEEGFDLITRPKTDANRFEVVIRRDYPILDDFFDIHAAIIA